MKIGLDAMGGDFAPRECVRGALLASKELGSDDELILFGDEPLLRIPERSRIRTVCGY